MTQTERVQARRAAKEFARRVRTERWAEKIPDEWDALSDEQIALAMSMLPSLGLSRRRDMRWERQEDSQ